MSIHLFLLWLVINPILTLALSSNPQPSSKQPPGFLLNCGDKAQRDITVVKCIPDNAYIRTGNISTLQDPDLFPLLRTLRFFPDLSHRKYCYGLPVTVGVKYLLRTTYYYGGFDGGRVPPVFDQLVDGVKVCTVDTTEDYSLGLSSYYEVVIMARYKTMAVCLARNNQTNSSPFISGLELQPLSDSVYNSTLFKKNVLRTVARHSFGNPRDIIDYPDDKFNRHWHPFTDDNPVVVSQSNVTETKFWNMPPAKVFSTGFTASRGKNLTVKWPPFSLPSGHYYIALYFQDNRNPSPFSWRVFDIYVNGGKFFSGLNVTTSGITVYGTDWPLSGLTEITLDPRNDMPVGPLINAGEVFQILPLGTRTLPRDANAMAKFANSFTNISADWIGDPCMPLSNSWSGVTCTNGTFARVTSLNLTGLGLSGPLPKSLVKLNALTSLYLGNNKFSGRIPKLSSLKSLQILHLENNQLEGSIPDFLSQLPKLQEVFLLGNDIHGGLPPSLTNRKDIRIHY